MIQLIAGKNFLWIYEMNTFCQTKLVTFAMRNVQFQSLSFALNHILVGFRAVRECVFNGRLLLNSAMKPLKFDETETKQICPPAPKN